MPDQDVAGVREEVGELADGRTIRLFSWAGERVEPVESEEGT